MLAVHIVATYIRRRRIPHTDWKQMAEDLGNTMQKAELEIGRGSLCFPVIYQTMMGFREKAKGKSKGYEGSMFRNILLIFEAMSLLHSGIQIPFGILWLTVIGLGCSSTPQDAQNLQSLQNLSTFEDCLQKLVDFHILEVSIWQLRLSLSLSHFSELVQISKPLPVATSLMVELIAFMFQCKTKFGLAKHSVNIKGVYVRTRLFEKVKTS